MPQADARYVLAHLAGERPPAPAWYEAAMREPVETLHVEVEGATIEVLCWGRPGDPGVLLLHGAGGHARWWGPIAPMLAQDYRVVSLSFAGMGGSDRRAAYSIRQMAREAMAVADATGLFAKDHRTACVAHSFGGNPAVLLGEMAADRLGGMVIIDSLLHSDKHPPGAKAGRAPVYATLAEALARFRLSPEQPVENLYFADDLARHALHEVPGGWTWRYDPQFFPKLSLEDCRAASRGLRCPAVFVRGAETSLIVGKEQGQQLHYAPEGSLFIDIPAAGHHVMVDQPLALLSALRALIAGFRLGL